MSMTEWAREEVRIACQRENPDVELDENGQPKEFDYGCSCYGSALKAYESLMNDEHSGFSFHITASILKRLIDNKPLTPIEDTEDVWNFGWEGADGKVYQCKRCSALFKHANNDGSVLYTYNDQCYCVDVNDPHNTWHSGFVEKIIRDIYPITMPFYPPADPIKVYCEEFLVDESAGDYDTLGVLAYQLLGNRIELGRYFKEGADGSWVEINKEEYLDRKKNRIIKEEGDADETRD